MLSYADAMLIKISFVYNYMQTNAHTIANFKHYS